MSQWWVCTCSTHFRIFLHIFAYFYAFSHISTHFYIFLHFAHMSTISEYFIMCPCITNQYTSKYLTLSTHALQHVAKTSPHLQMHILSYPIIFQIHYITSLNIFLHKSTHTSKIQYYPCTAHRIFATINSFNSSAFLMHWYTSLNIFIVQAHTSTLSLVSILPHSFGIVCPLLLKFSFALKSIVKHSYSPPLFSKINRCLVLLQLFLSHLHFISFSLHISHFSHWFLSTYSHLCLNPYLSVDTKKYGLLQSMGFGRAQPRAIFWVI